MRPLARARIALILGLLVGLAGGCRDTLPDGSMAAGPHGDLDCADCHTGPSSGGFVAAVSPGTCAACHADADLDAEVEYHNVAFTHTTHPGPLDEQPLGCAACHTHETGEADLGIATDGCFLCHAELPASATGSATLAADGCAGCHVQPAHTAFATSGEPIDHATVLERGISCLLCHYDVAAGSGAVEAATCRSCHGVSGGPAPLRGGESMAAADVHPVHLDTLVELTCARCHDPVDHRVVKIASSIVLDCGSCHVEGDPALRMPIDSAAHRAVQMLYAGLDPHHVDVRPALKFTERIACTSCHDTASTALPTGSAAQLAAIRDECSGCHGPRFAPLLDPWVRGMSRNTEITGSYVQAAAADSRIRANTTADSIARDAVSVWREVASADGVHNLPAADALLRSALASAVAAYRQVGVSPPVRPALGPDPADLSCARCHYGIQVVENTAFGETFSHDDHVIAGSLSCSRCHSNADLFAADGTTFDPAHGVTRITETQCATCHHVDRAGQCSACHSPVEVAALRLQADLTVHVQRNDVVNSRQVPFSHTAHANVGCTSCHEAGIRQTPRECDACHESHHTDPPGPQACRTCHGADLITKHQPTDHLVCGACHSPSTLQQLGTANRRFCLTCHTDKVDHQPEGECSTCHLVLSPAEAMRQIVTARSVPRGRE